MLSDGGNGEQGTANATRPAASRFVEAVVLAALTLLAATLYTHAAIIIDSGRDLGNAWQVATGGGMPAYGPRIYGTWSLGPAWYLLLALPFAMGGGLGAAALWTGVLAALKIPLAWAFARQRFGAAAALALAALVALPGWNTAGMLVLAHTAVVESAVWALLLAYAVDTARPRAWTPASVALLFALALHAHPTAIVFAPLPALALWRAWRRPHGLRDSAIACAAALLPLLPVLLAEAAAGWPQLHATQAYANDGGMLGRLARSGDVLSGWMGGGPALVADYLLPPLPGLRMAWTVVASVALLAAGAATLHAAVRRRYEPLRLLMCCMAGLAVVIALRATTPAYMTFALAPLCAWWFASAGMHGAPSAFAALRWPLAACAVLLTLGIHLRMHDVRSEARIDLPGAALGDVAQPLQPDPVARFWLAAGDHDRIARWLCAQPGTVALHGELASALDLAQGVAFAAACRDPSMVRLSGGDADAHWHALPLAHARRLGIEADMQRWGYAWLRPAAVLNPARGHVPLAHARYRVDDAVQHPGPLQLEVDCMPQQWLVVGNRVPGFNLPFAVSLHDGGGMQIEPELRTIAAEYFRCPDAPQRWSLRVDASDADAVDVARLQGS